MSRYRSQGLLAVGIGLAAVACGEPDLNTNLRPEGPPDLLAVLTQNQIDLDGNPYTETALRCKYVNGKRDPKAPGFVGDPITGGSLVCPENEADFEPATVDPRVIDDQPWAIRLMFDELLDADKVETLDCDSETERCQGTLSETRPVTLKCGDTAIRYYEDPADDPDLQARDRYRSFYVPNGNRVTFPLGPSIYISPVPEELVFPTGSQCSITIDPGKVTDKDGIAVPADDLTTNFKIADLQLIFTDPADSSSPATLSPDPVAAGAVAFVFNAPLDDSAIDPGAFQITDENGDPVDTAFFVAGYNVDGDAIWVYPDTDTGIFLPGLYTVTMKPTTIGEVNGGELTTTEDQTVHFNVAFAKVGQTSGTDLSPTANVRVAFNNAIDPATLDTANGGTDLEFFQTNPPTTPPNMPIPVTISVGDSTGLTSSGIPLDVVDGNAIIVDPTNELPIGTYVLRFKAGAELKDTDATAHTAKFTNPLAITYNVLLKSTGTFPPVAGTPPTAPLLHTDPFKVIFSGSLDFGSITPDDFTLVDNGSMTAVPFTVSMATTNAGHANDTVVITPTGGLTTGHTYQLTIKQGAAIKSANGVTRTFGAASTSSSNRTTWTITAI